MAKASTDITQALTAEAVSRLNDQQLELFLSLTSTSGLSQQDALAVIQTNELNDEKITAEQNSLNTAQRLQKEENDAATQRLIADFQQQYHQSKLCHPPLPINQSQINPLELIRDINTMDKTLTEIATIYASNDNIHHHANRLGQTTLHVFIPIELKYNLLPAAYHLEPHLQEILAAADDHKRDAINRVLATISAHKGNTEPETGLKTDDLLYKSWTLAKSYGSSDTIKAHMGLIIDNLHHNIAANGGCWAGIATRLTQVYTHLLTHCLKGLLQDIQSQRPRIS